MIVREIVEGYIQAKHPDLSARAEGQAGKGYDAAG